MPSGLGRLRREETQVKLCGPSGSQLAAGLRLEATETANAEDFRLLRR